MTFYVLWAALLLAGGAAFVHLHRGERGIHEGPVYCGRHRETDGRDQLRSALTGSTMRLCTIRARTKSPSAGG